MVYDCTDPDYFRIRLLCTGPIPTQLGQLTATMEALSLHHNQLTGRFLFAHRMPMVHESTFSYSELLTQAEFQPKLERLTSSDY